MQPVAPNPDINVLPVPVDFDPDNALAGIVGKRIGDNQWFALDSSGELVLEARPTGYFALAYEATARALSYLASCFFSCCCSGPSALEQKMVAVACSIEAYLRKDLAKERRHEFLVKYTPAINELYRSAERMHAVGKITDAGHRALRSIGANEASQTSKQIITRLIQPASKHDGKPYYSPTSLIVFSNEMKSSSVRFTTAIPVELPPPVSADVAQRRYTSHPGNFRAGQVDEVLAEISHSMTLYSNKHDATIEIDETGKMASIESTETLRNRGPDLLIRNNSTKKMMVTIAFPGLRLEESRVFFIQPKSSHAEGLPVAVRYIPEGGKYPVITTKYTANHAPLVISCKAAEYLCRIAEDGRLSVSVKPMIKTALPRMKFTLEKGKTTSVTYGESDQPAHAKAAVDEGVGTCLSFTNTRLDMLWLRVHLQASSDAIHIPLKGFRLSPIIGGGPNDFYAVSRVFHINDLRADDLEANVAFLEKMKRADRISGEVVLAEAFTEA